MSTSRFVAKTRGPDLTTDVGQCAAIKDAVQSLYQAFITSDTANRESVLREAEVLSSNYRCSLAFQLEARLNVQMCAESILLSSKKGQLAMQVMKLQKSVEHAFKALRAAKEKAKISPQCMLIYFKLAWALGSDPDNQLGEWDIRRLGTTPNVNIEFYDFQSRLDAEIMGSSDVVAWQLKECNRLRIVLDSLAAHDIPDGEKERKSLLNCRLQQTGLLHKHVEAVWIARQATTFFLNEEGRDIEVDEAMQVILKISWL